MSLSGLVSAETYSVTSPNGNVALETRLDDEQGLEYRVMLKGKEVVQWSDLGLITSFKNHDGDGEKTIRDFSKGLTLLTSKDSEISESYELKAGKRLKNEVSGKEKSLTFQNKEQAQLELALRAFDGGVAFRYTVLEESDPKLNIIYHTMEKELTSFSMGTVGTHFGQGFDVMRTFTPAYERPYAGRPIGTAVEEKEGVGWGMPALFELPEQKAWVLIHDSGYEGQYPAVHLSPEPKGGVYQVIAPPENEAGGMGSNKASHTLPWSLPWRFMVVSDDLAGIVESNMVYDLAPANKVKDTSWIKPGTVSWSWLSDHASSRDEAKLKTFIDLAAEMGWPYSLVDANWNTISDTIIQDLVAYGKDKGVDILLWYNSGGPHNWVQEEPRNFMHEPVARRAEFAKLQKLGVKGVKIDFFQSDKQFVMRQYNEILKDAADFEIMVNFHGCTAPRGWERTWPNLLTMEAVRGSENYTFDAEPYAHLAPAQNTMLPFTRNVIGSMDFTPVCFSNFVQPHITTNAHELALAVIFESGFLHPADSVSAYQGIPKEWKDFLKNVPTTWDETQLLSGYPGQYVVLKRRLGDKTYIAGINGQDKPRKVKIDQTGFLLSDKTNTQFPGGEIVMPAYSGFVIVVK